jgi:hypothetical protein
MFHGPEPGSSGGGSGYLIISNPAAIACPCRVRLIRDESAASGCLGVGCAWRMQTFAETAPAAVTCNSVHSTAVLRFFRYRPASFHAIKRI